MKETLTGLEELLGKAGAGSSGYIHTATEILSQPTMWRETWKCVNQASMQLKALLGDSPRLILSGAGSSHFVGVSVAPMLRKIFPYAEAVSSTDIVMDPESVFPKQDFILVSFARSGNSPEGIAVVDLAEKLCADNVKHLAITCNPKGELAKIVGAMGSKGYVLNLPEGTNDKGLAMTSSFTSMVLAGLLLQYIDNDTIASSRADVDVLSELGQHILGKFDEVARRISNEDFARIYFIASRPYFGGALEAHLKVQELSGGAIVAYASDTLGLRHGFMASIDDQSIVVFTSSSNVYRKQYELDILREIKKKELGKMVVVIADDKSDFEEFADVVVELNASAPISDGFLSIITVLLGQMVGFYVSLEKGLDPDYPSPKGIINRVVEGIRIYPYPLSNG
ncbi:MAG: SIS domain-containing protein [Sphaerochaetaceae bacterium]